MVDSKGNVKEAFETAVVPSGWAESMGIDEKIITEIKTCSTHGWALDRDKKPRALTVTEMQMIALACHKTGLSLMSKQIMFLGDKLYVSKSGRVYMARTDKQMPFVRLTTRPATEEERKSYGLPAGEIEDSKKHQFLAYCEVYALVNNKIELVASAYGHANYNNVHLKGIETDTFRLCKDMSETRAQNRALAQVYDPLGLDSYEDIYLAKAERPKVIDIEVEVVEPGTSVDDVVKLLEENKEVLGEKLVNKFTPEILKEYTPEALAKAEETIKSRIDSAVSKGKCGTEEESKVAKGETGTLAI